MSCGANQLYSHDDASKKPTVLPLCSEHSRVLICLSLGEQSAGSPGAKVPFGERFCMKPARQRGCKMEQLRENHSIFLKGFTHRTFETIARKVRIPDIPIALTSIRSCQAKKPRTAERKGSSHQRAVKVLCLVCGFVQEKSNLTDRKVFKGVLVLNEAGPAR